MGENAAGRVGVVKPGRSENELSLFLILPGSFCGVEGRSSI
jgi:hypothetical protein